MNEIEKMAEIICEAYTPKQKPQELRYADVYRFKPAATALVNAGYGNVKEAVREFAEKVKKFLDGAEVYFYNGEEEGIWDSIAVAEQINKLLKEVCGE